MHPDNKDYVKIDVLIGFPSSPPLLCILIMKFKLSRLLVQLAVLVSLVCMISYTFAKGFDTVRATEANRKQFQ